jgi:hypothetical protein
MDGETIDHHMIDAADRDRVVGRGGGLDHGLAGTIG